MQMLLAAAFGLALCAAVTGNALATSATAPWTAISPTMTRGTVTSIDKDNKTFVVTNDKDEEVTITYDDKTVWVLDGQISTCEAVLKEDYEVTVRHAGGAAARVQGKPKKKPS